MTLPGCRMCCAPIGSGDGNGSASGVYQRKVLVPETDAARVFLLKAAPGTKLPVHTHTGVERTQVLAGAFIHDGGRFGAGDFDDAEGDIEHRPTVDLRRGVHLPRGDDRRHQADGADRPAHSAIRAVVTGFGGERDWA